MASVQGFNVRERVRAILAESPNAMTMQIARELDIPEVEVIRVLPSTVELDGDRWEEIIRGLEAFGKVHVIVTNGAATLETTGQFGSFSTWDEFFNVQSPTLDMHIRWPHLGAIFAVEKPSHMTGVNTLSVQFYDRDGRATFKVFLNFGGKPTADKQGLFETFRDTFRIKG